MFDYFRQKNKKALIASKEYSVSNFIPFRYHIDSTTLLLKDNSLLKAVRLEGFPFETADDENVDINKSIRNQLFKSVSFGNFALSFHIIRRHDNKAGDDFFLKKYKTILLTVYVNSGKKHSIKSGFVNELYVTIVRRI